MLAVSWEDKGSAGFSKDALGAGVDPEPERWGAGGLKLRGLRPMVRTWAHTRDRTGGQRGGFLSVLPPHIPKGHLVTPVPPRASWD